MDRIRIAYTINWMDVGGSQTHLLQVLRLLDRSRFEPTLYCLTGKGTLLSAAEDTGARVIRGRLPGRLKSASTPADILKFAAWMRRERIDIVHNYLIRAEFFGSVAARLAGVPLVLCSKRGCHERRGLELLSVWISNRLAHGVTTNADAVRDFVHENEGCPREKMVVIPSGIDTDRFVPQPRAQQKARLGIDPAAPVVGIITRSRVRKGVEEFLRAMVLVREQIPAAHALVIGEVKLDDALSVIVREGGLEGHLHLLGFRSDVPELLPAMDVFVLCSHDEGMSNAILEAMSVGLPVVATNVGGTGEVVRHGQSGLLVPPRNPQQVASAVLELLGDPRRAEAMGKLGRHIVETRFSARWMVRQMEQYYLDMLRSRGMRRTASQPAVAQ